MLTRNARPSAESPPAGLFQLFPTRWAMCRRAGWAPCRHYTAAPCTFLPLLLRRSIINMVGTVRVSCVPDAPVLSVQYIHFLEGLPGTFSFYNLGIKKLRWRGYLRQLTILLYISYWLRKVPSFLCVSARIVLLIQDRFAGTY